MAISKITLNGVTQMDVTQKTITSSSMLNGITSLKNDGTDIIGSIQSQAGSIIISDECDDLVDGRLRYVNTNYNNAYYSWSNGVCTVTTPNGAVAADGSVYQLLITSPDALPSTVKAGETYLVTCESTSTEVRLRIVFRDSADNNIEPDSVLTESGKVSVPANAISWVLQIHVAPNTVLSPSATISNIHVYTMVEAVPSEKYITGDTIVAIASAEFVGSEVVRKTSSDLTVAGATITAPAGYYTEDASKSVASMTLPTAATSSATSGFTSKATISRSTSDQYINIPTGYNSIGAYYKVSAVANGTAGTPIATKGTVSNNSISITPSVTNTTGYITGGTKTGTAVTVSASELVGGTKSITESGTTDVTNYASASVAAGSVTAPSTISGTSANVSVGTNTLSLSKTISVTPTITTAGYVTSGTAKNVNVSLSASVNTRSSSDLTTSGATVTAPAGYYSAAASASVASGTAGTPIATKGSVSNNSVTVTPSVTNTTGYITGGTKTGTGVSVSASELVNGTKNVTTYGTSDVTNYANVFVGVPLVTGTFTGTTAGAAMDVTIPYTGSGYPIAVIIYPSEGCYNSNETFYGTVNQYACVYFLALKTMPGTAPTYTTGTNNNSQTINRYKSSTSDSTALATSSGHVNDFRDIAATASTGAIVEIRSATKISVFIKASSYGFAKDVEYTYQIVYSE